MLVAGRMMDWVISERYSSVPTQSAIDIIKIASLHGQGRAFGHLVPPITVVLLSKVLTYLDIVTDHWHCLISWHLFRLIRDSASGPGRDVQLAECGRLW